MDAIKNLIDFDSDSFYATPEPDFFSSPFSYIENLFDSAVDTVENVIDSVGEGFEDIRNGYRHSEKSESGSLRSRAWR